MEISQLTRLFDEALDWRKRDDGVDGIVRTYHVVKIE